MAFVAVAAGNSSFGSSISIGRPSGTMVDHAMIAAIRGSSATTLVAPSGWTVVGTLDAASPQSIRVFFKIAGASEPSSYNFGGSGPLSGFIVTYSGTATTTPSFASTTGTTSPGMDAPSVAAASDGRLVCFWAADSLGSMTPPASMVERAESNVSPGTIAIADEAVSAGSTGTRTATYGFSGNSFGAVSIAIANANAAPNAPTLTAPIGGATVDRTADIDLQGTFSDPDAGDELSEVTVEYRPVSGSTTSDTEAASGQTFVYTIPGGALSAGNYEWRAKTKDASGVEGPFSAWASFTAGDAPAAPVITDPADLGTVNTDPYTVTWTAPNQEAYQVRTVADSGGTPDTGTVYEDTGTVVSTTRSASIDFPTNSRTEHVQVRVRFSGLWSAYDSHQVSVSYTVPPTPTATVTADNADGSIDVAVANPTPSGSEPDVDSNQVQRQQSLDSGSTWTDEDGTVDAFNTVGIVAEDATYTDRQIRHLVLYRYRVKTIGDNGTNVTGAWTT